MTAYTHMQRLAKALRESEAGKAYGADQGCRMEAWPAWKTANWNGSNAPSIAWEEGPYEWAVSFSLNDGEKFGDSDGYQLDTDEATRKAYREMRNDGFFLECSTSWMVTAYRC